jgi:hypothetical protein
MQIKELHADTALERDDVMESCIDCVGRTKRIIDGPHMHQELMEPILHRIRSILSLNEVHLSPHSSQTRHTTVLQLRTSCYSTETIVILLVKINYYCTYLTRRSCSSRRRS